jgi:hypothetical protein
LGFLNNYNLKNKMENVEALTLLPENQKVEKNN